MKPYEGALDISKYPNPNYHPLLEAAATSCPPPLLHIAQAVFFVPGALGLTLPRVITFEEETNTSQYLSSLPPVLIASRPISKVRSHRMLKEIVIIMPITRSSLGEDGLHIKTVARFLFCISVKIWKKYVRSVAEGVR